METRKYFQLLREHFTKLIELNEIDVVDDGPEFEYTPEPTPAEEPTRTVDLSEPEVVRPDKNIAVDEYSNLGTSIAKISSQLSPQNKAKADSEIARILETGRSRMTHELYVGADQAKKNELEYVTSVLGALYKESSPRQQENIRTFMFTAYNPYGDKHGGSSKLARMVARKAGITYDITASKTTDAEYYMGIIAEGIYKAIDYALKNYNPNSTNFGRFMLLKASGNTMDGIARKEYQDAFTGFGKRNVALDEPIGGEGGEEGEEARINQMTSPEDAFTEEQKEGMKNLYAAIGSFIRKKLDNPKYENWVAFYKLFAEEGNSIEEISDMTGVSVAALRVRKTRLEQFLTEFVKNRQLPLYLKNKAGISVKFPNNKFSLSTKEQESEAGEPLYIFEPDNAHPEGGEWIEIHNPVKKYNRYMKDALGDIAFGTPEEETPGVEEPLTEVRDLVKEALMKERFLGFGTPKVKKDDALMATLNDEGKLFDSYLSNMNKRVRNRVRAEGKNSYNPETIKNFENMTIKFVLDAIKGSVEEARRNIEQLYPPQGNE